MCLGLFALNAWICRELFTAEFLNNLSSNDGAFISIARFFRDHGTGGGWFPWFNAGMPIENAYQPLLPSLGAIASWLSGWPIARAFHFVLALAYCCGPPGLALFAWGMSRSLFAAFAAGLTFSLTSPAAWLIPALRVGFEGHWGALRLYNLIHYAEDPHNLALALTPFALFFLFRAMTAGGPLNFAGAVLFSASVVAVNAFGAVDVAIGGACLALVYGRRAAAALSGVGVAAYCLISPWLPPSLIERMRHDQWGARGYIKSGLAAALGMAVALGCFAALWYFGRRLKSPFERFAILFGFWMLLIPLAGFVANVSIVPQPWRFQLELELAACLLLACVCARIPWRAVTVAALCLVGIRQAVVFRQFAQSLVTPIDITRTIEYKVDRWIGENLPGRRSLIAGDPEYLFNVFSDSPQMAAAHEPTAPNFTQLVAIFAIYTGLNAGDHDAEYSVLWLKAFGNAAVYVAGEKSREYYHAIAHPHKFDGLLPVLWHDEDDTVFGVPARSASLAHVVPVSAIPSRQPIHGLDVDPIRPYVAALDDPSLPLAEMTWRGTSGIRIRAPMKRGQAVSVQINYAPGWRARVSGREIPVRKDGIGLVALEPGCDGDCEIDMEYGPTAETWVCRGLSVMSILALGLILVRAVRVRAVRVRVVRG